MSTPEGERIKQARKARGLSQRGLAALIGVSAMAISKWERGTLFPGSQRLIALAEALGVKPGWIWQKPTAFTLTHFHVFHDTMRRR